METYCKGTLITLTGDHRFKVHWPSDSKLQQVYDTYDAATAAVVASLDDWDSTRPKTLAVIADDGSVGKIVGLSMQDGLPITSGLVIDRGMKLYPDTAKVKQLLQDQETALQNLQAVVVQLAALSLRTQVTHRLTPDERAVKLAELESDYAAKDELAAVAP